MKKMFVFALLTTFLLGFVQAHTTLDKPTFIRQSRAKLNKNQEYTAFKSGADLSKTAFGHVEETVLNYHYFNAKSRIAYLTHMLRVAVDKNIYSKEEARQMKAIVNAASTRNIKLARQLIKTFANSATTGAGKALSQAILADLEKVDAVRDGRQSVDGFWGALGRLVGAVVGAVAGAVSGGLAGAIAGALGGHKLGGIIGDAIDNMGNGVWAGPDGDHCDTPPFCA